VSKPPKPSKKHHFVPQAQLRHFARDATRKSIWVFDKGSDRAWLSSILNAGSENDFNSVELDAGKWNFEDLFQEVDRRSARLVSQIVERRSLGWLGPDDRVALIDLFATQILRTHFARTTLRHLGERMRELVRGLGFDPDADPAMAMPSDAALRLGAVRSFLQRDRIAMSMVRLVPTLFAAPAGQRFILSDDPVAMANAFPYGDIGLQAHGIIACLPVGPDLAVALVCPTIVSRYEAIDQAKMDEGKRARMEAYREGFRTGEAIEIEAAEVDGWNQRQVTRSARYLYAATDDFDFARQILDEVPELRSVETHIQVGEMGRPPPGRKNMPPGWQLVIQGAADHCVIPIVEFDEAGEGLTARTTSLELLKLVEADSAEIRAELYEDGRPCRSIGAACLERFGTPDEGWFRVVHRDDGLRALMRKLDSER
jgi:hypothetical protein